MARTASTMVSLGSTASDFTLPDVRTGRKVSLSDFDGKDALLVMFLSRHCPYVKHIQGKLAEVGNEYSERNVGVVAICSNDAATYPDDAPESLKEMAEILDFRFPYLFDESQAVARAYTAACTPDFFLYDGERKLVYRGRFDASRPGNFEPVTGADLRAALDSVIAGEPVEAEQLPSMGCNIKWKAG